MQLESVFEHSEEIKELETVFACCGNVLFMRESTRNLLKHFERELVYKHG